MNTGTLLTRIRLEQRSLIDINKKLYELEHLLPAPAPELPLTDRDRELARLVAGRCTNKEIAAALYLSEGTVKQYINQLYAKLDMGGDPRTRRARLAEWYQKNAPGINQKLTPG